MSEAPLPGAGPARAFARFPAHGVRFRGRASRSEYWWWMLPNVAVVLAAWMIAAAVPGCTVAVRRLHDTDRSGWWALLALLGGLGQLVLLLLLAGRSRPAGARFDGTTATTLEAAAR